MSLQVPRDRGPHRARRLVGGLLVVMLAANAAGYAFAPLLLRESPALLLAVLASYPQMALASARLDPVTFVLVAALRRWAGETIAFAAGRVFGAQGLAWFQKQTGRRQDLVTLVNARWWPVRDLLAVLIPHPLLSAALGAARMPPRRFVVLKLIGSLWSVTVIWYAAGAAASPLAVATDFVEANAVVLTLAAVAVIAIWAAYRRRATGTDSET